MAFRVVISLLAAVLLATTMVSTNNDNFNMRATLAIPTPVRAPVPAPAPLPVTKPPVIAPRPPIKSKTDCFPQCEKRCDVHSRKNVCMRACVTCCDRCKCVPPGVYGNQAMCGTCYTGMTTHGNRTKCP